ATDEEKLTLPVGVVATPAAVLTTVAVTVTAWPTTAAALEEEAEVEVRRMETVSVPASEALLWALLPAYVPVIVSEPLVGALTVTWQLDWLGLPVAESWQLPPVTLPVPETVTTPA